MPTQLQLRRGTTAQNNAFTGAAGELSYDTEVDTLRVHDGTTAGGFEMVTLGATQTLTNKTLTSPTINSATIAMGTNKITGLGDPTGAQDAATKAYIDSELSSLSSTTLTEGNSNVVVADSGTGTFTVTIDGTTHSTFAAAGITLSQGAFVGNVTGNADTATTLATGRTISLTGDVTGTSGSFDGSGNVSITATIAANSVALGTDTTGNYVATGATSGSGISGSVSSEGGTFTVTSNATSANTANTIVFRDGSGNFNAGVMTATATAARYADLAERYTSDGDYAPGTVVIFAGGEEVTQSTSRISRHIAGIVSTDPAYLMNSALENSVAVGLMGRVPCKVVGEINKGDMMVSSATPGHAEAWHEEGDPPMGTVIGKALENKTDTGEGVIEVVVGRM